MKERIYNAILNNFIIDYKNKDNQLISLEQRTFIDFKEARDYIEKECDRLFKEFILDTELKKFSDSDYHQDDELIFNMTGSISIPNYESIEFFSGKSEEDYYKYFNQMVMDNDAELYNKLVTSIEYVYYPVEHKWNRVEMLYFGDNVINREETDYLPEAGTKFKLGEEVKVKGESEDKIYKIMHIPDKNCIFWENTYWIENISDPDDMHIDIHEDNIIKIQEREVK